MGAGNLRAGRRIEGLPGLGRLTTKGTHDEPHPADDRARRRPAHRPRDGRSHERQGLLKEKDAGDTVVGPRVDRSVPHSFVHLGSGTNPYTGGTVALMADSALAYRYCY